METFAFIIFLLSVGVFCDEYDKKDQQSWTFVEEIQNKIAQQWLEPPAHWRELAMLDISSKVRQSPLEGVAKNTIFFIGDGMGIASSTAARVFKGQKDDKLRFGEEAVLHMDTFPYTGTSKTYCLDTQVADSSCSATAYLCGIKGRFSTAGLTPKVVFGDCLGQSNPGNHVSSVLEWAQREGKSTGIITNSGVTSIPGAVTWAGVAQRGWETDVDVKESGKDPALCPDTGAQLVSSQVGRRLNILMGGGRRSLSPKEETDTETGGPGKRTDGRNIINEWLATKPQNETSMYITGRNELLALDTAKVDNLFGVFSASDLAWTERLEADNDPHLEEMVEVAVKILSKNPNGFFLFVHGSKIDSAHHANRAGRAFREIVEFDKAVKKGDELTDDDDTLLVVSADHSHTLGFAAYNVRGNPILGHSIIPADDGLVFPTITFSNGPGPSWINPDTNYRRNIIFDNTNDIEYQTSVPVPMSSESHASEDVIIYAKGPYAHYFSGVHEQSTIPHLIAFASCTGEGLKSSHCNPAESTTTTDPTGSASMSYSQTAVVLMNFVTFTVIMYSSW